jgi:hypothetical protein
VVSSKEKILSEETPYIHADGVRLVLKYFVGNISDDSQNLAYTSAAKFTDKQKCFTLL